jgi:hypothetical protein
MTSSASPSFTDRDTPAQARFVYWFNGLFPILTSIITPLTVYRKVLRKPNISDVQRYNDLLQEVSRQFVSGTIGLISYFGGGVLTRGLMETIWKRSGSSGSESTPEDNHLKMLIGGQVLSFIGYSFVRPWLATDILYMLRKRATPEGKVAGPTEPARSLWRKSVVDWVDRHLMQDGMPRLGKAALFSFLSLGVYLNALAFGIYGLSRLFHARTDKAASLPNSTPPAPPPISPNAQVLPNRQIPGAYSPVYYPAGFPGRYGTPLFSAAPPFLMPGRLGF